MEEIQMELISYGELLFLRMASSLGLSAGFPCLTASLSHFRRLRIILTDTRSLFVRQPS